MKSSLVLAWACAVALKQEFGRLHPVVPPSPVIVYNVEDDAIEQRRRLSATLRQFAATPADIAGKVIRAGPKGLGTLLVRDDKGHIQFTPAMDRLKTLIEERQPTVLVVDPLAELHACEENDNNALRAVIAAFRELAVKYSIAVLVLHHTRKGSGASPGDPDAARGASAIIGAVRIALTLTGMSEADAEAFGLPTDPKSRSTFTRLDDAKQNYHPIRDAEWFQKHPHTLDSNEVVPAAEPWTPPAAKVASQTDLAALAKAIEQGAPGGEPFSPKLSADPRSVRHLLATRGFVGADAQKACLLRLRNECCVEEARFKRKNRTTANGLHVEFKPQCLWIIDGGAA